METGPFRLTLPLAYGLLDRLSPLILAHQGTDTMTAVRMNQGDTPRLVSLGIHTLTLTYTGRATHVPPQPKGQTVPSQPFGPGATTPEPPLEAAAILINSGPD